MLARDVCARAKNTALDRKPLQLAVVAAGWHMREPFKPGAVDILEACLGACVVVAAGKLLQGIPRLPIAGSAAAVAKECKGVAAVAVHVGFLVTPQRTPDNGLVVQFALLGSPGFKELKPGAAFVRRAFGLARVWVGGVKECIRGCLASIGGPAATTALEPALAYQWDQCSGGRGRGGRGFRWCYGGRGFRR